MKGVVFQTSTAMTEGSASAESAVQASRVSITPRPSSISLITPYWSLSIQPHIWAETTVGIAQGIRTAARRMPRPGMWALSVSATATPSTTSRATEKTLKTRVFQTDRHHSPSTRTPCQLNTWLRSTSPA